MLKLVPDGALVGGCRRSGVHSPLLEIACAARLLEESGAHRYRFSRDVIREVLELDLSTARRTMLH